MDHLGPKQLSATSAFVQSAGAKLLTMRLNAATGILAARALAPAGRGELSAMILWYIFLGSDFSLGSPSALTYRLRRHSEQISELSGAALTLSLPISVVLASFSRFLRLPRPGILPRRADLVFIHNAVLRHLRALQPSVAGGEA